MKRRYSILPWQSIRCPYKVPKSLYLPFSYFSSPGHNVHTPTDVNSNSKATQSTKIPSFSNAPRILARASWRFSCREKYNCFLGTSKKPRARRTSAWKIYTHKGSLHVIITNQIARQISVQLPYQCKQQHPKLGPPATSCPHTKHEMTEVFQQRLVWNRTSVTTTTLLHWDTNTCYSWSWQTASTLMRQWETYIWMSMSVL